MSQSMKNRIIQGAAELFTRFGYAKVRMEEISERLGISKKTIYNHFANKETLFNEMIEAMVGRISHIPHFFDTKFPGFFFMMFFSGYLRVPTDRVVMLSITSLHTNPL